MQTQLEIKGITKRAKDTMLNSTNVFGVKDNEVVGSSINNKYDINGDDAKKGGEEKGSLVDHLRGFDLTVGGDKEDTKARDKQLAYAIPNIKKYTVETTYSDADTGESVDANYSKIDTSLNIGQVVIY